MLRRSTDVGVGHRVAGPVDEAVRGDLVEAARLGEEVEQRGSRRAITAANRSRRSRNAARPSSTPMWWKVAYQRASQLAHHGERALEVLERRPGVAVVGPEAREVDVAEVQHVVGLDVEDGVAAGVPGRVDRADADAAQVEHVAVGEAARVGHAA